MSLPHPLTLALRHLSARRLVDGVASLTLTFSADGRPDLDALAALVQRTFTAGLTPAVNLYAGSAELLPAAEAADVIAIAAGIANGRRFLAGTTAEAGAEPIGLRFARACEPIVRQGATPVLVQDAEVVAMDEDRVADAYRQASAGLRDVIVLEADPEFGGRVYSLDLFNRLLDIPSVAGVAHAGLDRVAEWYRIDARDSRRPEFRLLSGNERAVDMMMYGSDYLLGTAGCAAEGFALRDRLWREGDPHALQVNDVLQELASLLHRAPIASSRPAAARWLHLRGLAPLPASHPGVTPRPAAETSAFQDVSERLDALLAAHGGRRARAAGAGPGS